MYLHLGSDVCVKSRGIVGVFDLDTASASKATREFLKKAQKDKKIVDISGELPKAFVVTGDKEESLVYLSQVSSATILKRALSRTGGI